MTPERVNAIEFEADAEWLLQHGRFLRRLVRQLVRDDVARDDVVQETWLAALRHGARAPGRRWLARVARNAARKALRGDVRRARREQDASAPAPAPEASPVEWAERLETAERLLRAVRELPQPYRDTIVRRYWQDLAPR